MTGRPPKGKLLGVVAMDGPVHGAGVEVGGAMYRAVTLAVLRAGLPADASADAVLARLTELAHERGLLT